MEIESCPGNIRAISIINPYGWLIAKGYKLEECRSWGTKFRGLCLLHVSASKAYEADFRPELGAGHFSRQEITAMRSSIIGFAFVTGCEKSDDYGDYLHHMAGPALFSQPIPTPGARNYWRPQTNRPRQSVAFSKAWELIGSGQFTAANSAETDYWLNHFKIAEIAA